MIECSAVPKCKNGLWFHYEVPDSPRPACVTVSEEDRQSGTDWLCPWCIGDGTAQLENCITHIEELAYY